MSLIENVTTEFKREYVQDIIKTVIAFANTAGGTIYIGIDDDGSICGISDIDGTITKITNSVRDSIKPDITMFIDYQTDMIDGLNILKIIVQKGISCPYYIAGKGIRPEGVYVRQGASSVPATEMMILKMIKDTDGEKFEDIRSINQELTFYEAEKEFNTRDIQFGTNQYRTLGIINNDGIYTNLGLILSDQCVHTIKAAVYDGVEKVIFKDRKEFTGSLLKQLNDVYDYIDRYNRIRSEYQGLHRIDIRDYPTEAIREALLNALVHRDYSFSGSTLISIFSDHIEFVSIGGLVKGISYDDIMLGISITRNEKLANIFYRLTLIESYGTGIPKIMRSYQVCANQPQIITTDNAFKIILPSVNIAAIELNENEMAVLSLFKNNDYILRKDVESALNISQAMAVRILRGLVDKDAIKATGKGKNIKYVNIYSLYKK